VTTLHQAEARALAAEAEVERLEGRLKDQGDYYHRLQEAREEAFVQRTADLREQLDSVHREARAQQTEAARVAGELEAARAQIVDLQAKLKPPAEEAAVVVRWLKDSPQGGASIGGRVYTGRGPHVTREPLLVDGHLVDGSHTAVVEASGDVQSIPLGAAQALHRAGYVHVLDPAVRDHGLGGMPRPWPTTAAEMRKLAAELEDEARQLERIEGSVKG